MWGITVEQATSLARTLSKIAGTVLVTYGITTAEKWDTLAGALTQIGGLLLVVMPIIVDMFNHSKTGTIKSAAALPEVQSVITTPKLADAIPSDKVRSERGR